MRAWHLLGEEQVSANSLREIKLNLLWSVYFFFKGAYMYLIIVHPMHIILEKCPFLFLFLFPFTVSHCHLIANASICGPFIYMYIVTFYCDSMYWAHVHQSWFMIAKLTFQVKNSETCCLLCMHARLLSSIWWINVKRMSLIYNKVKLEVSKDVQLYLEAYIHCLSCLHPQDSIYR